VIATIARLTVPSLTRLREPKKRLDLNGARLLALHALPLGVLVHTLFSVRAVTTIGRNTAIGSVVRATKELLGSDHSFQGSFIQGHTHAASAHCHNGQRAGAIGAV